VQGAFTQLSRAFSIGASYVFRIHWWLPSAFDEVARLRAVAILTRTRSAISTCLRYGQGSAELRALLAAAPSILRSTARSGARVGLA